MKRKRTFTFWKFLELVFKTVFFPIYFVLLSIVTLAGFVIDCICNIKDTAYLAPSQAKARKTDRFAKRCDFFIHGLFEYFKSFLL